MYKPVKDIIESPVQPAQFLKNEYHFQYFFVRTGSQTEIF